MKKKNSIAARLLIGLVFLFLYAPILLLIIFSFNAGDSSVVWKGFSLDWYVKLFQNRLIMESVYTTLLVSILATVISTVAGTFAAIGLFSLRRRWRSPLMTVSNIPTVNADIVTGVSMCLLFAACFQGWSFFARWFNGVQSVVTLPTRLTLGFATLLLAHIAFDIPYVILNVAPRLRQMDKNLIDAAQDLGCTWMQAFWKVILPEIKPGVVSGALIAFTMSVDDFVISYFTAGSSTSTLAMAIYGMTKKRVSPEINAVSTLLFGTVLILLVLSNVLEARQEKAAQKKVLLQKPAEYRPVKAKRRAPAIAKKAWVRRAVAVASVCALVAVTFALAAATSSQPVVNVCSWGEYIDTELITQFEDETGIRVNYQTVESNETLYSLLKSGGGDYDVIVPSDYMISQLIEEDMLTPLDYSQIPNFSLIGEDFKNLPYDPDNRYTVPYAWGTLGIIYNTTMVDEPITSWDAMFDPRYAGQVLLINNSRDALGMALMHLGYSVNTTNEEEIRAAYQLLADATGQGVYQGKVMDEVFQVMEGGNAGIATYYAGDYLTMLENNEDLAFVVPEEGSNWFMDAMCVLKEAPHYDEAMAWINFMASTDACLANLDTIWYGTANTEAIEQYPAYYEETYGEELGQETFDIIQTPPEVLERCEMYLVLPKETRDLYKSLWISLGV